MPSYRAQQQDLRTLQPLVSNGLRYILVVRAPGIGLQIFEKDRWTIMERRSDAQEMKVLYDRARSFLGDRGMAAVVTQRLVGREVETRIVDRHRTAGAISPHDFVQLDHGSQQIFWNRVNKAQTSAISAQGLNDEAMARMLRSKSVAAQKVEHSWDWWRPVLRSGTWIAGFSIVCTIAAMPPVSGVLAFILEAYARKYGW